MPLNEQGGRMQAASFTSIFSASLRHWAGAADDGPLILADTVLPSTCPSERGTWTTRLIPGAIQGFIIGSEIQLWSEGFAKWRSSIRVRWIDCRADMRPYPRWE